MELLDTCMLCGEKEDAHVDSFLCQICYHKKTVEEDVGFTRCESNCKACKQCLQNNIIAQFDQLTVNDFKCICGRPLLNEVVAEHLSE